MPGDEYTSTIRGGLKLKGAKPSGVTKKKKKPKAPKESDSRAEAEGSGGEKGALQKALEDEDAETSRHKDEPSEAQLRELDPRGDDGKTASERQYEEMRRKRVRLLLPTLLSTLRYGADGVQLQDRLAREGVKTHKQRVEELNKYLSTLSEHHDMPRIGPG